MFATVLILAFLAAALLASAVIATSLAKGLAAASYLRREIALCGEGRLVTVRHGRLPAERMVTSVRPPRRPVRLTARPLPAPQRVAA